MWIETNQRYVQISNEDIVKNEEFFRQEYMLAMYPDCKVKAKP